MWLEGAHGFVSVSQNTELNHWCQGGKGISVSSVLPKEHCCCGGCVSIVRNAAYCASHWDPQSLEGPRKGVGSGCRSINA